MTRGDEALKYLREFVARFAQPNTMYFEAGPVIETPLSAAKSLQDMLIQSWGGLIRIFPAVPAVWQDTTIHDTQSQFALWSIMAAPLLTGADLPKVSAEHGQVGVREAAGQRGRGCRAVQRVRGERDGLDYRA